MSSPSSSFMFTYYPAPTPGPASSPPTGSTDGLSFSALPGNGGVSDHSLGDHANMRNALSHLPILFIVCGVVLFWMIAFVFILCSVRRYRQQKVSALHSTEGRRQTWHSEEASTVSESHSGSMPSAGSGSGPGPTAALQVSMPNARFRPHKIAYPRSLPSPLSLPLNNAPPIPSPSLAHADLSSLKSTSNFLSTDLASTNPASIIAGRSPGSTRFVIGNELPPSPSPTSISFSSQTPLLANMDSNMSTRAVHRSATSGVEKPRSILKGSRAGSTYESERGESVYRGVSS